MAQHAIRSKAAVDGDGKNTASAAACSTDAAGGSTDAAVDAVQQGRKPKNSSRSKTNTKAPKRRRT